MVEQRVIWQAIFGYKHKAWGLFFECVPKFCQTGCQYRHVVLYNAEHRSRQRVGATRSVFIEITAFAGEVGIHAMSQSLWIPRPTFSVRLTKGNAMAKHTADRDSSTKTAEVLSWQQRRDLSV
jgi:hypothetical protein